MTTLSAIDIGYRGVKALASNGREAHFPSEVGPERKKTFSLEEAQQDSMIITTREGETWYAGQTAMRRTRSAGRRDAEWVFTDSYRVLLYAALSELHKATTMTSVVTGLPLEHWSALVERAREVFLGEHAFKRNGKRWQTVTVENVFIVTQPYGSLLDLAMTDTGRFLDNPFATGVVGIADVGGVTLNLLVTEALDEVGQWTRGGDLGLLEAIDEIVNDIKADCQKFNPKAREVAEWLVVGTFPYQDKQVDIAPYAEPHLEPLVEMILNHVSEVWREPGRYNAVLLTGGGAAILGPMLKARMNSDYANVTIAREPVFANVRGYLKLARRLWEKE
jgi:plasmid segregation protein ParM